MHVDDSVKTMKKDIIMSNTVRLHRVFSAPVERVYRAFVEPDALVNGGDHMDYCPCVAFV